MTARPAAIPSSVAAKIGEAWSRIDDEITRLIAVRAGLSSAWNHADEARTVRQRAEVAAKLRAVLEELEG